MGNLKLEITISCVLRHIAMFLSDAHGRCHLGGVRRLGGAGGGGN